MAPNWELRKQIMLKRRQADKKKQSSFSHEKSANDLLINRASSKKV
jgi:hypothetical protein